MGKMKETLDCYLQTTKSPTENSGFASLSYVGLLQIIQNFVRSEDSDEQLSFSNLSAKTSQAVDDFLIEHTQTFTKHETLHDAF